jgi:hypothetical protein
MMKGKLNIFVLLVTAAFLCAGTVTAQVKKTPAPVKKATAPGKKVPPPIKADPGMFATKIFSVARATINEILIRWAPSNEGGWVLGNKYGYALERYTIVRNGQTLERPERSFARMVFKPKPMQQWDSVAVRNDDAAVLAQAIYGDDFDVELSDKEGIAQVVNKTNMLTQRFNMSMYSADHSYEAAEYAGLAWRDRNVKPGEKYFYRVYSMIPQKVRKTDTALLYLGLEDYQQLPKPSVIIPEFGDKTAILKWDYEGYKEHYTSYLVERSSDGGKTFESVTDKPVSKLSETDPNSPTGSMLYIDVLPGNDTVYQYRIAGLTLFGETSPWSDIAQGKGKTELALTPHITGITFTDNGGYLLSWEFEDSLTGMVREFQVNQAPKIEGPYSTLTTNITPATRSMEVKDLYGSNYYTVTVVSKEGETRTSFPYLLQPEDSVAPAMPYGLEASIDSAGIVVLKWEPNKEKDLAGYKIFRANVKGHEFTPLMDSIWTKNEFHDTVDLKNLNHTDYYTVRAVDTRYNQSEFTKTIEVKKPDILAPTQPVLADYLVSDTGVHIQWINSSDEDVVAHKLYRKLLADTVTEWTLMQEFRNPKTTGWTDKAYREGFTYSYTMVAVDSARLESEPALPLSIAIPEKRIKDAIKKLNVEVDRTNRSITINWIKIPEAKNIRMLELYRAQDKEPMSLYKQLTTNDNNFIDTGLQVNTRYKYAIRAVFINGRYSDFVTQNVIY